MPEKSNVPGFKYLEYLTCADDETPVLNAAMNAHSKSKYATTSICLSHSGRYGFSNGKTIGVLTFNSKTRQFGLTTPSHDGHSRLFEPFKDVVLERGNHITLDRRDFGKKLWKLFIKSCEQNGYAPSIVSDALDKISTRDGNICIDVKKKEFFISLHDGSIKRLPVTFNAEDRKFFCAYITTCS